MRATVHSMHAEHTGVLRVYYQVLRPATMYCSTGCTIICSKGVLGVYVYAY